MTDFLPARTPSEIDSTLAIDTIEELFPEKDMVDLEEYFATPCGSPTSFETDSDLPGFQSEIQHAATEFDRFAEEFHAFASECHQYRGAL